MSGRRIYLGTWGALGGLLLTFAVGAADNMRFHGALVFEACDIQAGDEAQNIPLGMTPDRDLYRNQRTQGKLVQIHLVNCDTTVGTNVTATFIGTENSALPGLLAFDAGSTAAGVAVGLETSGGRLLPLNIAGDRIPLNTGSSVIAFNAFLQGEPAALANRSIVRGTFTATTTFLLDYQ
ncbi:fimbrial protein [Serratia fonticola]